MLDTSITFLMSSLVLGFIELVSASLGLAQLLFFAFLVTFLISLLLPRQAPQR